MEKRLLNVLSDIQTPQLLQQVNIFFHTPEKGMIGSGNGQNFLT